ncbi:MAG: Flp pilus assembly protein CpaB [Frankiales bacterium]|nr:Flp pilus assembly protein CpaB [Frankiales bacterium]
MSGLLALHRALARYRVLLSAGLATAAVAAGLSAVVPAADPGVSVLTAARDLVAGAPLRLDDVVTTVLPEAVVPAGALLDPAAVVGRLVAGPVRQGEPLTDVRLLGAALVTGSAEVAVPVRVAEPATAALVQAGDGVDVLSAAPEGGAAASVVARGLRVLSVPSLGDDAGEGALLVVAADRETAARLAAAAVTGRLSVVVAGRS